MLFPLKASSFLLCHHKHKDHIDEQNTGNEEKDRSRQRKEEEEEEHTKNL